MRGRQHFEGRQDGKAVRLVLEALMVVDTDDVTRAHDRAQILARAGVTTFPIAVGRTVTPPARRAAREAGVWIVTVATSQVTMSLERGPDRLSRDR